MHVSWRPTGACIIVALYRTLVVRSLPLQYRTDGWPESCRWVAQCPWITGAHLQCSGQRRGLLFSSQVLEQWNWNTYRVCSPSPSRVAGGSTTALACVQAQAQHRLLCSSDSRQPLFLRYLGWQGHCRRYGRASRLDLLQAAGRKQRQDGGELPFRPRIVPGRNGNVERFLEQC